MIIYPPEIEIKHSEVTLSARVEMDSPISGLPDRLWFTFPEDYASHLSGSSNALAASLLLTAMYFDEDLEVRGKLSSRLLYGLQEYQQVYHAWFPQTFHLMNIWKLKERPIVPERSAQHFPVGLIHFITCGQIYHKISQSHPIKSLMGYLSMVLTSVCMKKRIMPTSINSTNAFSRDWASSWYQPVPMDSSSGNFGLIGTTCTAVCCLVRHYVWRNCSPPFTFPPPISTLISNHWRPHPTSTICFLPNGWRSFILVPILTVLTSCVFYPNGLNRTITCEFAP
jgi:hypothetical protein